MWPTRGGASSQAGRIECFTFTLYCEKATSTRPLPFYVAVRNSENQCRMSAKRCVCVFVVERGYLYCPSPPKIGCGSFCRPAGTPRVHGTGLLQRRGRRRRLFLSLIGSHNSICHWSGFSEWIKASSVNSSQLTAPVADRVGLGVNEGPSFLCEIPEPFTAKRRRMSSSDTYLNTLAQQWSHLSTICYRATRLCTYVVTRNSCYRSVIFL